jgi:peptide/nickel transport system substrate-binding protein
VRGGTWVDELQDDPTSFIPDAQGNLLDNAIINQALYLPLFYGDAQGQLHPGAALEIPTVKNGGINADATLWTFHLRPGLVWSDGQPYDARDVDYTWRVWSDPTFSQFMDPSEIIHSAEVSPDHLSITFHLTQPYAPFLSFWVDGEQAPLPWHHFNTMAPGQIQHSPDNLNPTVSSGPFLMQASQPSDHYTLVRNPRYYLASQGLPYLDQLVFRIGASDATILQDFQAGTLDSTYLHWDVIFRPINSSAAIGSSLRPRAM